MNYSQPFFIEIPVGNNAFSYEERAKLLGKQPKLFVPDLIEGTLADVQIGDQVVFEDIDEFGELKSCFGLKHLVKTAFNSVPVVIVDNHNHVFYFWWEAMMSGVVQNGATLVHIDQHKDMRVPEKLFLGKSLQEVFEYTNFELNVGNYIVPAKETGLLGEVQLVTSEMAMDDRSFVSRTNKIVNIDLDFFAPELDYINFAKARKFIRDHMSTANLITIATSPFFIDQARAIDVLKKLLDS